MAHITPSHHQPTAGLRDRPSPRAASAHHSPRCLQRLALLSVGLFAASLMPSAARANAYKDDEDPRHRSGLTGGVGLYGSLTAALFGQQVAQKRENGVGGGGMLVGQFGWFLSDQLALVLDAQLSLQHFSVGEGVTSFNSVLGVDLVGLTGDGGFLLGGIGLAMGQRSDVDNPDGQSFGAGVAPTVGAGYDFWTFGNWSMAAELRFTAHIYPGSDNAVTMLQWAAGIAVHRR